MASAPAARGISRRRAMVREDLAGASGAMPSARHARMMRTAISPRLAMRRRRMGFTVRPEASMVDDRNDQRLAEHDLFGPQGVSSLHERPHLRITHERPGDPQRKGWIPKIPLVGYPGHDPGGDGAGPGGREQHLVTGDSLQFHAGRQG